MRSLIMSVIVLALVLSSSVFAGWTTPALINSVSSEWPETGPVLSPDGLTMYFARGDTSTHYYYQMYQATRNSLDEDFGNVMRVPELITSMHIGYPWVSPDGLRLYYNYDWDLVYSDRASVSDPWGPRHYLSELNAIGSIQNPRLSADERCIVFNMADGPVGGYDIYVASRPDVNLPFGNIRQVSELNTTAWEGGGHLSPDGLTLYYTSNYGGTNYIYKTTRPDINEPFGTPEKWLFTEGFGQPWISDDYSTMLMIGGEGIYISYFTLPSSCEGWTTPKPVTIVNTPYQDGTAFPSFDGMSLYFSRWYTPEHSAARIYEAKRDVPGGPFTSVEEILRGSSHLMSPWVSPDNLRMYYTDQRNPWTIRMSQRASVSDPWSQGVVVGGLPSYTTGFQGLSEDELTIVFGVKDQPGGAGSWDMCIATRPDRNSPFTNVRNLDELNTPVGEGGSRLSPDGLTIYYQHDGDGICMATRPTLNDSFGNVKVLSELNMPGRYNQYPCISSDGTALYFMSGLNGEYGDVYVSYLKTAPVADAGDDQIVYSNLIGMAEVTLDGSASYDAQGNSLTYIWSYIIDGNEITISGVNPHIVLPGGIHTITLIVNNGECISEADEVIVEVVGPLKVNMKLMPVFPWPPSRMLIAEFDFPANLNEQLDPYSIALAADPNITADYFDFSVYGDSIRRCNVGFNMNVVPKSLLKPKANIVIFGSFKSGRLFYGEGKLKNISPWLMRR